MFHIPITGLLFSDEPTMCVIFLHERIIMRIVTSNYYNISQSMRSLAWYHNGTDASRDRVSITNDGTSLTVSNMTLLDVGCEVKFNSIGSEPADL